jgi:hypothetical protein
VSSVKKAMHFCILIMRPGREEGKYADRFRDRKIQKHAIARWKVALERLRVGIILKFPYCF